jgi:hypothetical protein
LFLFVIASCSIKILNYDTVRSLYSLRPSSEDRSTLAEFAGDPLSLGRVEQFFLAIMVCMEKMTSQINDNERGIVVVVCPICFASLSWCFHCCHRVSPCLLLVVISAPRSQEIPRYDERLKCFIFKLRFWKDAEELQKSLDVVRLFLSLSSIK